MPVYGASTITQSKLRTLLRFLNLILIKFIFKKAIKCPQEFVLKPQLEGGGGNYYGEEITEKLMNFSFEERASHILMQKIKPLVVRVIFF